MHYLFYGLDPKGAARINLLKTYLKQTETETKTKLKQLIGAITLEDFSTFEGVKKETFRKISFLKPVDTWDLDLYFIMGSEKIDFVKIEADFFKAWSGFQELALKIDTQAIDLERFPSALEPIYTFAWSEKEVAFFHAWFAWLWQEAGGTESGISAQIKENNSAKTFDLNRLRWDRYIDSKEDAHLDFQRPFGRNLSLEEIELFVSLDGPDYYVPYWRYFERGDAFAEIGRYASITGWRMGKLENQATIPIENLTQHASEEDQFPQDLHVANFCESMIHQGFISKERPSHLPKDLIAFAPILVDSAPKSLFSALKSTEIEYYEQELEFDFPPHYTGFLKVFNGCIFSENMAFLIRPTAWKTVAVLWGFGNEEEYDIESRNDLLEPYLPEDAFAIGLTTDGTLLCLDLGEKAQGSVFYYDAKRKEKGLIAADFGSFLQGLFSASFSISEEDVFARSNDLAYFKKRIAEGWEVQESTLMEAARSQAYEVLEYLFAMDRKHHTIWVSEEEHDLRVREIIRLAGRAR